MCVEISFLQNIEILGHNCSKIFYSDSHEIPKNPHLFEDSFEECKSNFVNDSTTQLNTFYTFYIKHILHLAIDLIHLKNYYP